ncbi:MAG: outer membrane protein transport protein [Acidobacteriota bacterium]|nr:outer membrane protein transport protein [Acidobacteriota bacterium]
MAAPAAAQGYGLYEQGACMMARAGAGVAAPCSDGSAIFYNPAGLALDGRAEASLGGTAIAPRGTFTNDSTSRVSTLSPNTYFAPTIYAAMPWHRAVVGLGLFAPYGLTSEWPTTAEGRFVGYKSSVKSFYIQPTFAFRATDRVMFGVGLDITHMSVELNRRLDLSSLPIPGAGGLTFAALGVPQGTDFADLSLTGSGNHAGAHVGFLIKANKQWSFGGRYLFRQTVSVSNGELATRQIATGLRTPVPLPGVPAGTPIDALLASEFGAGAVLGPQTATTSLPLPDQLVLGGAYQASKELRLFVDYQFTHWSLFKQLVITNAVAPATVLYGNWKDTHGVRIGGEYTLPDRVVFRAGFDAHTAAEPDQSVTPILPEAPRREVAAGVGVPIGSLRVDFAYMYVHQSDRAGRSIDTGAIPPTVALNNGLYHYYANLFGVSLVLGF